MGEYLFEAKLDREIKYVREFYQAMGHYLKTVGGFYKFCRAAVNNYGSKKVDQYVLDVLSVFGKKLKALGRDYAVIKELAKEEKLTVRKRKKIRVILRNFFLYYEPLYFEFWSKRIVKALRENIGRDLGFDEKIAVKSILKTGENAAKKAEKLWKVIAKETSI